jgi:hypothetical protein
MLARIGSIRFESRAGGGFARRDFLSRLKPI